MEPNAIRVFTTQARESRTEPTAITLTNAFDRRRPNSPFTRKPSNGNAGMSHRCCIVLVLHGVHVVHVQGVAVLEHGQNDGQAYGRLGSRHHHYEKGEQVTVHLFELVREGDEAEIY